MHKLLNVQSLLWLALALALAGSLKHLASIFASVDGDHLLGWLQAVAIDAGLFALAYSIRQRRADRRSVKPLWFGVALFTTISIYGNLAYGLAATHDRPTDNLPCWIVATMPIVLAASLPVLVIFLSELLSDDRQHAADVAEKEARKAARAGTNAEKSGGFVPGDLAALDRANDAKRDQISQRRESVLSLMSEGLASDDIADSLGVSVRTVRRDIKALNGRAGG